MNAKSTSICLLTAALAATSICWSQATPIDDTAILDKDGTARITRVIPVPKTISPEAQAMLATGASWAPGPRQPAAQKLVEKAYAMYPVKMEEKTIAGVKTRVFTPPAIPSEKRNRVLIDLHGGGFTTDSGSFLESIPIASLTSTQVIAVDYRLAPQNVFPAAVDDVVAVYRELLKTYAPENMALYGTSAGASLTAQSVVRFRQLGLPLPAALGFFSGNADSTTAGDSRAFYAVAGLAGATVPAPGNQRTVYLGPHDPADPVASPIKSDLRGLPPVLCMTGTRDTALSGTVNFHRALLRAGVDSQLIVYDALPHAFWYTVGIPEAVEALEFQAKFLDGHLGRLKVGRKASKN
jgi:monoterpene epsilon-lactone hydrolase